MEDQSGEESLFEGMEFVLSMPSEEGLQDDDAHAAVSGSTQQEEHLHTLPSEPLDADLFTGLSMLSESNSQSVTETAAEVRTATTTSVLAKTNSAGSMDRKSFESIMAAYDSSPATQAAAPPLVAGPKLTTTVVVSKSGRRKKRSLRIGYGRDNGDVEDREFISSEVSSEVASSVDGKRSMEVVNTLEVEAVLHENLNRISVSTSEMSSDVDEKDNTEEAMKVAVEEQEASKVVDEEEQETALPPSEADVPADKDEQQGIVGESAGEQSATLDSETSEGSTMTIEGKLQAIKQQTEKRLQELEAEAAIASSSRKLAAQSRREATEKLSGAAARRKELETQLEDACEKEDFELADKLSQDVADAENLLELADMAFKEAETNYDLATLRLEGIVNQKIAIEEEGALALEELRAEAEATAEKVKTEAAAAANIEMDKLNTEEEQLNMKNTQYMLQLRALEEAKLELDGVVSKVVEPEIEEKNSLLAERQLLVEELEDLLKKVKAKEAEIAKRDELLVEIGQKIAGAVGQFEEKQVSLETDLKSTSSLLEEIQSELDALRLAKQKTEESVVSAQVESEGLQNTAALATSEALLLRESLERRRKATEFSKDIKQKKLQLTKKEDELLVDAQALKGQASAARASLQDLSSSKIRIQQNIGSIKQKIADIEKRGPDLEAEKRLAAAARNFKEAARLSAEAKALLAEKEGATGELQKSILDLQKLEEEIETKILALADIEAQIAMKEKEAAETCCKRLRLVAVAAKDERNIAIELDDFEEAESLQAEADAADAEADELQRIHQFEGDQFQKLSNVQDSKADIEAGSASVVEE